MGDMLLWIWNLHPPPADVMLTSGILTTTSLKFLGNCDQRNKNYDESNKCLTKIQRTNTSI